MYASVCICVLQWISISICTRWIYLYQSLWHFAPLIHQVVYQIKNMLDWKTRFRQTIVWLLLDLVHVDQHWKKYTKIYGEKWNCAQDRRIFIRLQKKSNWNLSLKGFFPSLINSLSNVKSRCRRKRERKNSKQSKSSTSLESQKKKRWDCPISTFDPFHLMIFHNKWSAVNMTADYKLQYVLKAFCGSLCLSFQHSFSCSSSP